MLLIRNLRDRDITIKGIMIKPFSASYVDTDVDRNLTNLQNLGYIKIIEIKPIVEKEIISKPIDFNTNKVEPTTKKKRRRKKKTTSPEVPIVETIDDVSKKEETVETIVEETKEETVDDKIENNKESESGD